MSDIVIAQGLSPSAALQPHQPLRATFRRSGTSTAREVVSLGFADTTLATLWQRVEEKLGPTYVYRGSAPTFTQDTVTVDLVVAATVPQGYNASQLARALTDLVPGFPLETLSARVRVSGSDQRSAQIDAAALAAQQQADANSFTRWLAEAERKLGFALGGVVIVALIVAAVIYLPKPHSGEE